MAYKSLEYNVLTGLSKNLNMKSLLKQQLFAKDE